MATLMAGANVSSPNHTTPTRTSPRSSVKTEEPPASAEEPSPSRTTHFKQIREREGNEVNDKFMTPPGIAQTMVEMVQFREDDTVLEPCAGTKNIFNLIPDYTKKIYCEVITRTLARRTRTRTYTHTRRAHTD